MVNRQDIRNLNAEIQGNPEGNPGLIDALDRLEELHELSQRSGVTVDDTEFADAQEDVKDAVATLINAADDMVDRTDVLEDSDGNTLKTLPNAALSRDTNKDIPSPPQ